MLKNLLLTTAATVGLLGAGWTSQASADTRWNIGLNIGRPAYYPPVYTPAPAYYPPVGRPVFDDHYHVEYRAWRGPWVRYGTYGSHRQAHDAERFLERQGYNARVVHH